ncbi:MAG: hypothetical protein LUC94_01260 [Clostridiales bacterium]|nr:hypothetical protein [Clostridiales bacterium]
MAKLTNLILGFPKSLLLSFYYFPVKRAIRLPIMTGRRLKIGSLGKRTAVQIPEGCRVKIGFSGSFALSGGYFVLVHRRAWELEI